VDRLGKGVSRLRLESNVIDSIGSLGGISVLLALGGHLGFTLFDHARIYPFVCLDVSDHIYLLIRLALYIPECV